VSAFRMNRCYQCVWKQTWETAKKKAGLFRPGLLPFKTPVSALILPSAASKKQQKKNTV
jgi:hypothetical protein